MEREQFGKAIFKNQYLAFKMAELKVKIEQARLMLIKMPLAFTGGILALIITGNYISVVSMIGFVMLSGVVVNNGIVLIDYTNQLMEQRISLREAVVEAAATRLRPVVMKIGRAHV